MIYYVLVHGFGDIHVCPLEKPTINMADLECDSR